MSKKIEFLKSQLQKRILVLDGAMGTMLQAQGLKESDFNAGPFANHPKPLMGDNDVLCITRPDAVKTVHNAYLEAGADIIETNTFNSNAVSQADYGLEDRVYDLAFAGAKIAREAADAMTARTPEKPRFVAGSMGPTGRTASMSPSVDDPAARNIAFDELAATYQVQAEALIDGGADILLVETIFDTLNAKAAVYAIGNAMRTRNIRI
ncbi:MAG: homocysteine S-methyltransferase family protein, partial [Victivallales bacterium]|nr:homocysteine S-methyltransferase family protein [Victivallales bacterium]